MSTLRPEEPHPDPASPDPASPDQSRAGAPGSGLRVPTSAPAPVELRADEARATVLMGKVKAGDGAAFDELVRLVRARAFHVAAGFVGSRDDALELCQDTFLKVFRARATYRESEPFMPWFHRILRNTCFSFLRKSRRLEVASLDADDSDRTRGGWQIEADLPPVSAALEAEELGLRFRSVFERLSARDREILTLRHFDDLSYRDIARVLEIPEGTVMSRLFHARRRLKDALGSGFADLIPPDAASARPATDRAARATSTK